MKNDRLKHAQWEVELQYWIRHKERLLKSAAVSPNRERLWFEGQIRTCDRWIAHYTSLLRNDDDVWLEDRFLRGN